MPSGRVWVSRLLADAAVLTENILLVVRSVSISHAANMLCVANILQVLNKSVYVYTTKLHLGCCIIGDTCVNVYYLGRGQKG